MPKSAMTYVNPALQDLYKPESARFRAHLSGVINFAKFREEKLGPYTELQESSEGLYDQRAQLEEHDAQLVRCLTKPCG